MQFNIFKIFQIFGIVSTWSVKAFEDGKVTAMEAIQLATALAGLLGIPTDISLPTGDAQEITPEEGAGTEQPVEEVEPDPPPKKIIQE